MQVKEGTMDQVIREQQLQAKEIVEQLLSTDERARNDDLWLILQVWQKMQQIKLYIPYEDMNRMISPETITRVRRQIQNTESRLLPTNMQVCMKRKVKEDVLRAFYGESSRQLENFRFIKYGR